MGWLTVETGHQVSLVDGKIVARNAKGKELASVPAKVKKTPEYEQLQSLSTYLQGHDSEAGTTVTQWMQRGLPVPRIVLERVWRDPWWQSWLKDDVVTDGEGTVGFMRDATTDGIGIVDADGESVQLTTHVIYIPHPAALEDLEDLREFSVELGVTQRLDQLFREVHRHPDKPYGSDVTALSDWSDGFFENIGQLTGVVSKAGGRVRSGQAVISAYHEGERWRAYYFVGDEGYGETGDLWWTDESGNRVAVDDVPPIPYSEGVRLASLVYAARDVEEN